MMILIADDAPVFRHLLEESLARWEYEVVSARDGNEACRILPDMFGHYSNPYMSFMAYHASDIVIEHQLPVVFPVTKDHDEIRDKQVTIRASETAVGYLV